ncbi:hypothetical protein BOO69_03490 [Sulfitobacter alexandrii]|uniref:Peptide methionine sulfoxide reductase n=1 Tax=Sulfitobacter alexandrii TaxID=1917485 RepID=A0A1J0WLS0_9RHOB|nr:hypothetical protein BOO69_03490 [Sulfitobacter alexandrii]
MRALPEGTRRGRAHGRAYVASKSTFNGGRSIKLVAEQLGGPDYISLNFYLLESGPRLFPCEMTADKVIAFLRTFIPDRTPGEVNN